MDPRFIGGGNGQEERDKGGELKSTKTNYARKYYNESNTSYANFKINDLIKKSSGKDPIINFCKHEYFIAWQCFYHLSLVYSRVRN